jgi:hypothetical protein
MEENVGVGNLAGETTTKAAYGKTPRASPYNFSARYGLVALLMSRRHVLLHDLLALIVEHGVAPSEIRPRDPS